MSRQLKLSLIVLGVAILGAVALVVLRPAPEERPRESSVPLVRVVALEISDQPLQVDGSGTVQPREEIEIGPEVGGRLTYVDRRFREGSLVPAGTTLLRIDTADYRNRVQQAQADVAAQNVAVLQAGEEVRIARQELDRFADRRAQDAFASTIEAGDYASRILPPREFQDRLAPQPSRGGSPTRLATREPQLQSARAARDRAQAQLADARLALSRTSVSAPFTGLVRSESAAVGTLVQAGQTLGSIVPVDAYEVRVSLTEDEAALIPGLLGNGGGRIPAQVYFDYGGLTYRWSARVDRADAILDAETRTIDVFLYVPNPLRGGVRVSEDSEATGAPPLLIGSFVRAEIEGASAEPFAQIPAAALRPGNKIWVVRDGKLRILPVRVIQRTDDFAYITTPSLAAGGRVVTSSLRAPVDGMAVRTGERRRETPAPRPAIADEAPADE